MPRLMPSPWVDEFDRLLDEAHDSLVLCAPYVTAGPCHQLIERMTQRNRHVDLDLHILTDLSRDNMLCGSTDVNALLRVHEAFPRTTMRFLPSLHAKIYVADQRRAIVTSGNLTDSSLRRNFEYGVSFDDPQTVATVRADVLQYATLGSPIDQVQLRVLAEVVRELKDISRAAQRSVSRRFKAEFDRRLADADAQILQARAAGRTAHAIFADAIVHLLRGGPLTTVRLNAEIQRIHPDLCDDSVDRIINGQHFGKKWKHAVRTAQVYLRRAGRIVRQGNEWTLVPTAT